MNSLLFKIAWNYHDVMRYFGCRTTKAYEIMAQARKRGGAIKELPNCVKRDVLLAMCGTTAEYEIKLLKLKEGKEE